MKWIFTFVLIAISIYFVKRGKNNVCTTFSDYYSDRDNNPNCYYNPDHELEAADIIRRHGYPVEAFEVTTVDGYILTIYRIPHAQNETNNQTIRKPILLNHGVTMNCGSFLINRKPLAFMLVDAGYDVWLGNMRGSKYSRNHITLDNQSAQFWDFSIHELGVHDVRTQIDFITEKTNKKLIYVGFSLSAAAGYIYGSTFVNDAKEKIDYFIALAPGVFVDHLVLNPMYGLWTFIFPTLNYLTGGVFYPRPPLPSLLFNSLCFPLPFQIFTCQLVDMIMLGYNYEDNDPETLPVTLLYNRDATSLKTLNHYMQILNTGQFKSYDHGENQNKIKYATNVPLKYDLSAIKFDSFIVYAENDKIGHEKMVNKLYAQLPDVKYAKTVYKIKNTNYNHIDILSGKSAAQLVYMPIIEELKRRDKRENVKV